MKLFLHIGHEKTATSAIQQFFGRNRDYFKQNNGLIYPKCFGEFNHVKLPIYFGTTDNITELKKRYGLSDSNKLKEFKESVTKEFCQEIENAEAVLLSNEHCASRLKNEEDILAMYRYFKPYFSEIKVILYLRNQVDMMVSSYSTSIKSGNDQDFGTFYKNHRQMLNYYSLVKMWASVFGAENMIIRPFDKSKWVNNNIIDDIIELCNIKAATVDLDKKIVINESLDQVSLEFLRVLNKFIPQFVDDEINPNRLGIIAALEDQSGRGKYPINEKYRFDVELTFRDLNRKLIREFLSSNKGQFSKVFEPITVDIDRVAEDDKAQVFEAEELIKVACNVIVNRQVDIFRLKKIINDLKS